MRDAFSRAEDHAASFLPDNWAKEGDPDDGKDRLWKQYGVLVDLYKYYLGGTRFFIDRKGIWINLLKDRYE